MFFHPRETFAPIVYILKCDSLDQGKGFIFKKRVLLTLFREAAKKVPLLMAGPLRPNPPPPLELNGR